MLHAAHQSFAAAEMLRETPAHTMYEKTNAMRVARSWPHAICD